MNNIRIGFAMCGSFCTFGKVTDEMRQLADKGYNITPVMSFNAFSTDTRFGRAEKFIKEIEEICGKPVISKLKDAEPIGPKGLFDVFLIEPCTGNTLAKLTSSIADTPVTLGAKSHLRNHRPVVIAVSTNDALSGSAKNIGLLLNRKNIYFVPFRQDDFINKPFSAVADFSMTEETIKCALERKQIQPIILSS